MFSVAEKRMIAEKIEKILLDLKHPEMPDEKPSFKLHVNGKEPWSWADIEPNWVFDDGKRELKINMFNEASRDIHDQEINKQADNKE